MTLVLAFWHLQTLPGDRKGSGRALVGATLVLQHLLQHVKKTLSSSTLTTPPWNCFIFCYLQPRSDTLPCGKLLYTSSSPMPSFIWEGPVPPTPLSAPLPSLCTPSASPSGHCHARSSCSKVSHPSISHICTRTSLWTQHIYFPIRFVQKAY